MKLRIRNLSNEEVEVEVDPTALVDDLRLKVSATLPEVKAPMLIFKGKILQDSKTLESYSIEENSLIVTLMPRAKPAAAPPAAVAPPAPSEAPASEGSSQQVASAESVLVTGEDLEGITTNIVAMGFELPQVQAALRAAFNNPDRAVEYLMNGFPPSTSESAAPATAAENPDLAALRNLPQFEQIRAAIQENPQLLPTILQTIYAHHPQLAEAIMANQNEFLALMSEPSSNDGTAVGPGQQQGGVTVQVTQEQQNALSELEALGFDSSAAVQALIACDWNTESAANFLFDTMGEED